MQEHDQEQIELEISDCIECPCLKHVKEDIKKKMKTGLRNAEQEKNTDAKRNKKEKKRKKKKRVVAVVTKPFLR